MRMRIDRLDVALLRQLLKDPRAGMRAYARDLDVARGTVQSRLSRMERAGLIRSFAPQLSEAQLGFPVLAFVQLHLAQGHLDKVSAALSAIPELIEAHSITGEGDLLCRVVARDTEHLEDVIQRLVGIPGVVRSKSDVAMTERVAPRVEPLLGLVRDED